MLVKKLWKAALEDPSAASLEAPPPTPGTVSMMVVGAHPTLRFLFCFIITPMRPPTLRVALTICADEEHHLQQA
jgi:hypothetical protein